jgi:hypothetical protein
MNDSPVSVPAALPAAYRRLTRRPGSLTAPMLLLALVAGATAPNLLRAGDAPSRVVPSAFVDRDATKPCLVQIEEQGLSREIAQLQAAVHACMKSRFNRLKAERPDLFPLEGKPQANRPK